jgi:histidine ammonia-lyase
MSAAVNDESIALLIGRAEAPGGIALTADERKAMLLGRTRLEQIAAQRPVYGVNSGFGPLADFAADPDAAVHGKGLIAHLAVGQGPALPPEVTRLMVWIRLRGMTSGCSAIHPDVWESIAAQWNAGFIPIVPQDGSLSASGDLVPLAHAAQAAAGNGRAWRRDGEEWTAEDAGESLCRLGVEPVRWEARSALAFVNGTTASLARALVNHRRLEALAHATAIATGRLAALLGCDPEPFSEALAEIRGHRGHRVAAAIIRGETGHHTGLGLRRPFQESYSVRCAPQVVGAVLDQLRLQRSVLTTEAGGCTDNPVVTDDRVLHGGNFHAAPVALVGEQHSVCAHQLAYLLERQLALTMDPKRNGGLPAMLSSDPGRGSGMAGVQIAATSHLGAIRQSAYPASCTPVPTNMDNQDHVPLALNGANTVALALDRAWLIAASLYFALTQMHYHMCELPAAGLWGHLADRHPRLNGDRPLADEIAALAAYLERHFTDDGEETLS